ncbi:MAG: hypothetical protein KI785_04520 [Devosiaceae bacterium]|nr:hypothetical protein [Devosiaceae bacterium MH13]
MRVSTPTQPIKPSLAKAALCALILAAGAVGFLTSGSIAAGQALESAPPNPVARPQTTQTGFAAPAEDETPSVETPAETGFVPTERAFDNFDITPPDTDSLPVPVQLLASLTAETPPLERDLSWQVYTLDDGEIADDDLLLTSLGGALETTLPPGSYLVHVAYGMASLARPVTVGPQGLFEQFTLGAGGMTLRGAIAAEDYLPDEAVTFAVYAENADPDAGDDPIVTDVDERTILVVPAGRYTVISNYGSLNASVRAQIDVDPGQLTEAVMFHQAAEITLKLVNEPNGEALPNTAWSVLNEGGDVLREFVGAFPTMVLAAGDYTIIARNEGQVFTRNFSVVAGVNREVELVAQ